jgi:hypothetical protein
MIWSLTARNQPDNAMAAHAQRERCGILRAAMLEALDGVDTAAARMLKLRIHCSADAVAIWYMRPELMSMLASQRGEVTARQMLACLSVHFQGLLPAGLAAQLLPDSAAPNAQSFRQLDIIEETS